MISDIERREVAPDTTTDTTKTPELTTKCDRDALLALADEMELGVEGIAAANSYVCYKKSTIDGYARRIREALGVTADADA